jgi:BMFP domain-containing protein YqiC
MVRQWIQEAVMQSHNPFFDDVARVASGALGALSGLKAEMEALVRQQMERFTGGLDMVSREEFEVVQAMAQKARLEQDALIERIALLEARLAELSSAPDKSAKQRQKAAPKGE